MKIDFKIEIIQNSSKIGANTYSIYYSVQSSIGPLPDEDQARRIAGVIANAINAQGILDRPLVI